MENGLKKGNKLKLKNNLLDPLNIAFIDFTKDENNKLTAQIFSLNLYSDEFIGPIEDGEIDAVKEFAIINNLVGRHP